MVSCEDRPFPSVSRWNQWGNSRRYADVARYLGRNFPETEKESLRECATYVLSSFIDLERKVDSLENAQDLRGYGYLELFPHVGSPNNALPSDIGGAILCLFREINGFPNPDAQRISKYFEEVSRAYIFLAGIMP